MLKPVKPLFKPFLLLIASALLLIVVQPADAAGEISSLELRDVTFAGCNSDSFQGSFKVAALDSNGAVVNTTQPVETQRFYATSYAFVPQQRSSTSIQTENFFIDFNGAPITYGSITVVLVSNPAIQSLTYVLNCQTGEITTQTGPDTRINFQMGDLVSVLYASMDSEGKPVIKVYDVDGESRGRYAGTYPYAQFEPYLSAAPETNIEIAQLGKTVLYALSSGEFQINIGPDSEGKVVSIIFTGIPPVDVYKREYSVY